MLRKKKRFLNLAILSMAMGPAASDSIWELMMEMQTLRALATPIESESAFDHEPQVVQGTSRLEECCPNTLLLGIDWHKHSGQECGNMD